jgi:hypothetical protein
MAVISMEINGDRKCIKIEQSNHHEVTAREKMSNKFSIESILGIANNDAKSNRLEVTAQYRKGNFHANYTLSAYIVRRKIV